MRVDREVDRWIDARASLRGLCDELDRQLARDRPSHAAAGRVVPSPGIRFCPHPAETACQCRKPKPGMLLDIMRHFRIGPSATMFVGDALSDHEAAARAGVPFMDARAFFAR
jgi:HAD superfamily hydrolase (TIGR01662 family)